MDAGGPSSDEVSALVGGRSAETGEAAGSARTFALGSDASRPMASLPALDRMSERIARKLRNVAEPFTRTKPMVTAEPVAVRRFDAWKAEQPEFTGLTMYRFRPLKGGVLIKVDPGLVSSMVDSFYGGTGAAASRRTKEFTGTEERLLTRFADGIVGAMTKVWSDVMPVEFQFLGRETNAGFASLVEGTENVAVARFNLTLANGSSSDIDIVYPVSSLRAVENELSAKAFDDTNLADNGWRERMVAALCEVRLEARSVLARPNLTWTELLKLQPGDVIPISFPSNVPLLVAGREIAVGKIGDQEGRAAIKIESMSHGGE